MSLEWARVYGTYSNKSDSDIDTFRQQKLDDWENQNITGTIIVDEGNTWLELEGDDSDVDAEIHAILGDGFFDDTELMSRGNPLNARRLDNVYTYYEDKAPITTLD